MTLKVFVTGVTGYIGGDAFYEIFTSHPDYEYTCSVRDSEKGAQVASQYSNVKLIYCTLDDVDKLEAAAQKADIVLNCANADHEASAHALVRGLTAPERDGRPGHLIHTSGTGILMHKEVKAVVENQPHTLGGASPEIYDDWDGIDTVTSLPDDAPHRKVDKIVIEANNDKLRTAIVCPPTIYGVGRGPGNRRGHQVYELARCTLDKGHGVQIGEGKTFWTHIHVRDMTWGDQGYYFTESGEHVWGEVSKLVAVEAFKQGYLPSDEVKSISPDEADQMTKWGSLLWGANSRCRAVRARKLLNWEPVERGLVEEIPSVVESESKALGLAKGHAARVS